MSELFHEEMPLFPTEYAEIVKRIQKVDPIAYGKTRNFIDGKVTYLSPYISRGVISTKQVFAEIKKSGYPLHKCEKFIQELAWRDYWQQIWIHKGNAINQDLKKPQAPISNTEMPEALMEATTGIAAIDKAVLNFYQTGYLHNHVRMYIAFLACNLAQSHWKTPARWMYFHLLDADWASNSLSWQWVAGANSNKKYHANQENINRYCRTEQKGTFLDVPYEAFASLPIPEILEKSVLPNLNTTLPDQKPISIDPKLPTLIYNFYNMDPNWKNDLAANRILLLEPSHFREFPVSNKTIDFVLALSKNIQNLQVYVGGFDTLVQSYGVSTVFFKEHPLNDHYKGTEEPRDWLFSIKGHYPSFFAFWKKCKKELPY